MKLIGIYLFAFLFTTCVFGQSDPIEVYNAHTFACDTGTSTLEITFCVGDKLEYADSLLNDTYKKLIKSIDKSVIDSKKELTITQTKKNLSREDKTTIQVLLKEISNHQRLKASIIKSQKEWVKLRDMNSEVISISCEDGRECNAITILAEIDDTLERIKKLQTFIM